MNKKPIFIVLGVIAVIVIVLVIISYVSSGSRKNTGTTISTTAKIQDSNSNDPLSISTPTPTPTPTNSTTSLLSSTIFADKINGFQIYPPKNWEILSDSTISIPVVFMGPSIDEDTSGSFQPSLSVYIASYAQTNSLTDLIAEYKKQVTEAYPDFILTSDQDNSDKSAHFVGGTYTTSEGLKLRNLAMLKVVNGKAYTVNELVLSSKWSTYSDMILKSMLTFKLGTN